MLSPRPTDAFGPVRSRLLATATWLRARSRAVFLMGVAVQLALLIPFHFVDPQEEFIGVPGSITSLIVVAGAIVGGPRVGAALALTGGVTYDTLVVTETWLLTGVTTAAVIFVWLFAGIVVGMLGDRYRGQVARSLDQAHSARQNLERVLDATPAFHARGTLAAVARAICDGARGTFDCDLAALFAVEGERLRLLARSPYLANLGERLVVEPSLELQQELTSDLRPVFVSDIRDPFGPRLPRAVTGDHDQVSALRVPVLLDERPVAMLALSWARSVPEPSAATLAIVQRYAEHAAVALAQAQRAEAQREVSALYRRFQASLVPALSAQAPGIDVASCYRPGERRMLLGGDFIDVVDRPDGHAAAVIGDVTGHGPDAAALGSSLRAAWRALMLRGAPLSEALRTLNSLTLDESERAEQGEDGLSLLATICAVELDTKARRARFVVAGHPAPLVLGDQVEALRHPRGVALGLEREDRWETVEIELEERWGLLLFTDGIIEARVRPGTSERLGGKGLAAKVDGLWRDGALSGAALSGLVDSVQAAQGGPLPDDVTLLSLAAAPRSS